MSVFRLCDECVHYKPDGKGLGDCQVHGRKVPPSRMNSPFPVGLWCKEWKLDKTKEYKNTEE